MDGMKEAIQYQPDLDPIDWRTSSRRARNAIVRHVPLILTSVVVCFVLLLAYVRIFPPVFTATALLEAESDSDTGRVQYYAHWDMFRKVDMKSEPELLTSGRVAKQVVEDLHLKFNDVYHTMFTQIGYLWTESWVGRNYRKFKEWLFPPDPSMYKPTPEEIEFARTVNSFRDGIRVEQVAGTSVAKVTVMAPSYRVAQIANRTVDIFLEERRRRSYSEADKAYQSLSAEVSRASEDLAAADEKKADFEKKNQVVLDFEKDKLLLTDWAKLKSSVNEVNGTIAGLEASLAVVERELGTEPAEIVQATRLQDSQTKGLLQKREFELNSALQQMREHYLAGSPDIQQLERLLAEVRASLAREPDKVTVAREVIMNPARTELRTREQLLKSQLASAYATLASKRKPLDELQGRMDRYPQLVKSLTAMARVRDGLESRYKLLRERLMVADVSRATASSAPSSIRVIDYASPPTSQSWPKMIILAPSALALGLFLGFGMALLAEIFSTRVNRDRLSTRPEYPVYAVIDMLPVVATRGGTRAVLLQSPANDSAIARLRGPS